MAKGKNNAVHYFAQVLLEFNLIQGFIEDFNKNDKEENKQPRLSDLSTNVGDKMPLRSTLHL